MARGQQNGGAATLPAPQNGNGGGRAVAPAKEISVFLDKQKDRIAEVLPANLGLTAERVIKLACLAIHKNPKLLNCTQVSILSSVLDASSLGLEIGGALAEAYQIPYGNECTFQPDYKGLLKLSRRSGEFQVIETTVVYERDLFNHERNPAPTIHHKPFLNGHPGRITHCYAYAYLLSGHMVCELMRADEVEEIRQKSRAKDSLMWVSFWGEGAKKTVLKRLLKRQARSVDVARAIEADDREYIDVNGEVVSVRRAPQRGVSGLRSQLSIEADAPPLPPQPSVVYSEAPDSDGADSYEDETTEPLGDMQGTE